MEEVTPNEGTSYAELVYDKEIAIATAKHRMTKTWTNRSRTISNFVKTLSKTIRTDETIEQFMKFPKNQRQKR